MFGYVTINKNELKLKDYQRYRSFYCGLCHSLRVRYGLKGQLLLPNDMTFVDLLLNGLYERPLETKEERCVVHPLKKQTVVFNELTDYCADMGLLLAYYKMLDDVKDEGSLKARAYAKSIEKPVKQLAGKYPRQRNAVEQYVSRLSRYEENHTDDLDLVSGVTGEALGEILVYNEHDLWADELRRVGFFLGKYIYLLDAYEDLEKDTKADRYNPWTPYMNRDDFDALAENTLTMMMAECAKAFEQLPIVQDADILRNILYSGVWTKFREIQQKRNETTEDKT